MGGGERGCAALFLGAHGQLRSGELLGFPRRAQRLSLGGLRRVILPFHLAPGLAVLLSPAGGSVLRVFLVGLPVFVVGILQHVLLLHPVRAPPSPRDLVVMLPLDTACGVEIGLVEQEPDDLDILLAYRR